MLGVIVGEARQGDGVDGACSGRGFLQVGYKNQKGGSTFGYNNRSKIYACAWIGLEKHHAKESVQIGLHHLLLPSVELRLVCLL